MLHNHSIPADVYYSDIIVIYEPYTSAAFYDKIYKK